MLFLIVSIWVIVIVPILMACLKMEYIWVAVVLGTFFSLILGCFLMLLPVDNISKETTYRVFDTSDLKVYYSGENGPTYVKVNYTPRSRVETINEDVKYLQVKEVEYENFLFLNPKSYVVLVPKNLETQYADFY